MDGRVKSRGRRSLVKRHRGSRPSVPVPAARRQRVEPRLGSMLFARPTGADRSELRLPRSRGQVKAFGSRHGVYINY